MWIISLSYQSFSRSRGVDKSDPKLHPKKKMEKIQSLKDCSFYRPTCRRGGSLAASPMIAAETNEATSSSLLQTIVWNVSVESISRTPRCPQKFCKNSKYGRILVLSVWSKTRTLVLIPRHRRIRGLLRREKLFKYFYRSATSISRTPLSPLVKV